MRDLRDMREAGVRELGRLRQCVRVRSCGWQTSPQVFQLKPCVLSTEIRRMLFWRRRGGSGGGASMRGQRGRSDARPYGEATGEKHGDEQKAHKKSRVMNKQAALGGGCGARGACVISSLLMCDFDSMLLYGMACQIH